MSITESTIWFSLVPLIVITLVATWMSGYLTHKIRMSKQMVDVWKKIGKEIKDTEQMVNPDDAALIKKIMLVVQETVRP